MARAETPLYVGTNGFVAALDPRTGEELWRTKVPKSGATPVTLLMKGRYLYVGCTGRAFCLDKRDGALVWENGLKRMGWSTVLLLMEGADATTPAAGAAAEAYQRAQDAAASAGATAT